MNISELIRQNQLLAYILGLIAIVGTIWKVNHALYVKPRDFVIDSLKDDMTRLKSELDELRGAAATSRPEERSGKADSISGRRGAASTLQRASVGNEIEGHERVLPIPASHAPPTPVGAQSTAQLDGGKKGEAPTPLTSLRACYEQWKTPSFTELQKKRFEKEFVGKKIDWDVSVYSVSPASHGQISVTVQDEGEKYDRPSATVRFAESQEDSLVAIQKDDRVNVKGTLREFFLWPTVDGTAIRSLRESPS